MIVAGTQADHDHTDKRALCMLKTKCGNTPQLQGSFLYLQNDDLEGANVQDTGHFPPALPQMCTPGGTFFPDQHMLQHIVTSHNILTEFVTM